MNEQNFCTIEQAARRSGLSQYFLRQRCRAGTIPVLKVGRKYLIDYASLMEQVSAEARPGGIADGN